MEDVTVGTAEIFQGKEKPIMIISTVRSDGKLGFVAEERVSIILVLSCIEDCSFEYVFLFI